MEKTISNYRFTSEERILVHLLDFCKYQNKVEVPLAVTQQGIAHHIRIESKHIPRALRTMIHHGFISERITHVRGKTQRMKTYFLTNSGEEKAQKLRDHIFNLSVIVHMENKRSRRMTVTEFFTSLDGSFTIAEILSSISPDGLIEIEKMKEYEEAQKTPKKDAIIIYKKALAQAWMDGSITIEERAILQNLRETLHISEQQHCKLEDEILKTMKPNADKKILEVYKIALEQALTDNHISEEERAILEKIKKHFNLKNV